MSTSIPARGSPLAITAPHDGLEQRADRDANEQEPLGCEGRASPKPEQRAKRHARAREAAGEQRRGRGAARGEQHDHDAQHSARSDAEQVGTRHRVGRDSLQQRAGESEHRTRRERAQETRHAPEQPCVDLSEGPAVRTLRERERQCARERKQHDPQQHSAGQAERSAPADTEGARMSGRACSRGSNATSSGTPTIDVTVPVRDQVRGERLGGGNDAHDFVGDPQQRRAGERRPYQPFAQPSCARELRDERRGEPDKADHAHLGYDERRQRHRDQQRGEARPATEAPRLRTVESPASRDSAAGTAARPRSCNRRSSPKDARQAASPSARVRRRPRSSSRSGDRSERRRLQD